MMAFEYEPEQWPPEDWFSQSMRQGQRSYLRLVRDTAMIAPRDFMKLCETILEAYGLPANYNRGSAEVLMDFYRYSRAKHKRAAERKAWGDIPVQDYPEGQKSGSFLQII